MMENYLIFATNNRHKASEARAILGNGCPIATLDAIGFEVDIPETGQTLLDNARQKARFIAKRYGGNIFADDTGLEVTALNQAPGVLSARYAGDHKDPAANRIKLLRQMDGKMDRSARFRTVIVLIWEGREYVFEGIVRGNIIWQERGSAGFGYDSLFVPLGYSQTFGELGLEIKNAISHRAAALKQLKKFLDDAM
jgi:XTP/dITP diphosphohydrolase